MRCWGLGGQGGCRTGGAATALGDSCATAGQSLGKPTEGLQMPQGLGPIQAPALTQHSPEPVTALAQQVDVTSCPPPPCQRTCEGDTRSGAPPAHPHSAPSLAASGAHSKSRDTLCFFFFLSPHFLFFHPICCFSIPFSKGQGSFPPSPAPRHPPSLLPGCEQGCPDLLLWEQHGAGTQGKGSSWHRQLF